MEYAYRPRVRDESELKTHRVFTELQYNPFEQIDSMSKNRVAEPNTDEKQTRTLYVRSPRGVEKREIPISPGAIFARHSQDRLFGAGTVAAMHNVHPTPREVYPPMERREVYPPMERREVYLSPERREVYLTPERREVYATPRERREVYPTIHPPIPPEVYRRREISTKKCVEVSAQTDTSPGFFSAQSDNSEIAGGNRHHVEVPIENRRTIEVGMEKRRSIEAVPIENRITIEAYAPENERDTAPIPEYTHQVFADRHGAPENTHHDMPENTHQVCAKPQYIPTPSKRETRSFVDKTQQESPRFSKRRDPSVPHKPPIPRAASPRRETEVTERQRRSSGALNRRSVSPKVSFNPFQPDATAEINAFDFDAYRAYFCNDNVAPCVKTFCETAQMLVGDKKTRYERRAAMDFPLCILSGKFNPEAVSRPQHKRLVQMLASLPSDDLLRDICEPALPLIRYFYLVANYLNEKWPGETRPLTSKKVKPPSIYRITPDLWGLTDEQKACVEHLIIERPGVGEIRFHSAVDVRRTDFERDVILELGEVVVYPEETTDKPAPGEGLNVPCSITLYNCMVGAKNMDPPRQARFLLKIRAMTEAKGATFRSFDIDNGIWKFDVHNF